MKSLSNTFLDNIKLSTTQATAMAKLGEYKGKQQLFAMQRPETLDTLKKRAVVESSESSNRIEGIVAPHNRVESIVLDSATPIDRSEQEIAGYRDALSLIHESSDYMSCSVNVILQLHTMLHRYLPAEGGRWKMTNNEIIETLSDGSKRVRFMPVSAVATPQAVETMTHEFEQAIERDSRDPLIAIPLAILDFLCIHPFSDGNGRISRLLTLLLLHSAGYEVGRFISLERIIEESKETYYEALELSSRGWHEAAHNVHPWLDYFWGSLIRAYGEFESRIGCITTERGSKSKHVRTVIERKMLPFAISELESDCPGISRDMIRVVLRQMRSEGLLKSEGRGPGARWYRI